MSCQKCGACCRGWVAPGGIPISELEAERLPEHLVYRDGVWLSMQQILVYGVTTCAALDIVTGECTIYENRPSTCRDFLCRNAGGNKDVRWRHAIKMHVRRVEGEE